MAEFTPIETQEQFDAIIKDRIARVEKSTAEKYSDYAEVKAQNEELTRQIAQLTEQIRTQTETLDGSRSIVDDLTAKVQAYETASVKTKVALELGIPYQMASKISGNTEEEIREDALLMAGYIKSNNPVAPLGSGEPIVTKSDPNTAAKASFKRWLETT